jgi:DNA-binding transcriptional ArsR family regulator
MAKISIDTPLFEITLRKYEKPQSLNDRELVRKLCLSLGVLQPGDSRDVIVDILYVLLKNKKELTSKEIEEQTIKFRKENNLLLKGIAPSNIRRQLSRLRDIFIIEKIANNYHVKENSKLIELFSENIERYTLKSILERVKEYMQEVDKRFEL